MPVYKFKCEKCSNIEELFCKVSEKEKEKKNLYA
jgi:predicted nucleic acid-binding Zn ribbon protein